MSPPDHPTEAEWAAPVHPLLAEGSPTPRFMGRRCAEREAVRARRNSVDGVFGEGRTRPGQERRGGRWPTLALLGGVKWKHWGPSMVLTAATTVTTTNAITTTTTTQTGPRLRLVCGSSRHSAKLSSFPELVREANGGRPTDDTAIRETWFLLCGDRGYLVLVGPYLCFNIFKLAGVNLMRRLGLATAPPPDASSGPRISAWRREDVLPSVSWREEESCAGRVLGGRATLAARKQSERVRLKY
ncbi:hypothetical protein E2C01_062954 [Portunus trituberculatus]|uniref:Uncharacterized protein n=1 Tax=Portunus trituberculatus TaxID=210409 RepID=A0A5B7HGT9_PORTR|nr:hypothetical protein [Portunus trituberculatus]